VCPLRVKLNVMDLLARIERYYDTAPRAASRAEDLGPFTLFVGTGPWPYYARPRLGATGAVVPADVVAVRERQRELGVPEAFEWVDETTPSLVSAAAEAGLTVHHHPLLVLDAPREVDAPEGVHVGLLDAEDPALVAVQAAIRLGFGEPGTAVGVAGPVERDALSEAEAASAPFVRRMLREGHIVRATAWDDTGPLAGGTAIPRGEVAEIAGIGTLPAARRRGIGAAVTAALVDACVKRGVTTIFLSAADDAVARIYERAGFRRAATACIAEPPADPPL
jgi:ribosomal protein S18 acetylase RimI-like enzyme